MSKTPTKPRNGLGAVYASRKQHYKSPLIVKVAKIVEKVAKGDEKVNSISEDFMGCTTNADIEQIKNN